MFRNFALSILGLFAIGALTAAFASPPPPPMRPPVVRTMPARPVTSNMPRPAAPTYVFTCPQLPPTVFADRQGIMNPYSDIGRLKAEIRSIEAEIGRLLNLSPWDYVLEPLSVEYWEGVLADKLALLNAWTR